MSELNTVDQHNDRFKNNTEQRETLTYTLDNLNLRLKPSPKFPLLTDPNIILCDNKHEKPERNPTAFTRQLITQYSQPTTSEPLSNSFKRYQTPRTPYLPPELKAKIKKAQQKRLTDPELVNLLKEIADLTITFYSPRYGQCIAISIATGEIVASARNEFDLLMSLQGEEFSSRIFVWKVGSDSFAGWRSWLQ